MIKPYDNLQTLQAIHYLGFLIQGVCNVHIGMIIAMIKINRLIFTLIQMSFNDSHKQTNCGAFGLASWSYYYH